MEGEVFFSAWDSFPTKENPYNLYQYSRVIITRGLDVVQHNRQTYDLLQWLGDVGGLLDGTYVVIEFFLEEVVTIDENITESYNSLVV